jgi:hypothetical protein
MQNTHCFQPVEEMLFQKREGFGKPIEGDAANL